VALPASRATQLRVWPLTCSPCFAPSCAAPNPPIHRLHINASTRARAGGCPADRSTLRSVVATCMSRVTRRVAQLISMRRRGLQQLVWLILPVSGYRAGDLVGWKGEDSRYARAPFASW
jgi:hypothetical protein